MRAQEPQGAPAGTGRRRVVLIEDEPDIAEAIGYQLQKVGLEVRVARTGEEGLHAVRAGADLVLLDLNLPGMDGLQFFNALRQKQPEVQGIVLTGFASIEAAKQAVHMDMVEFLTKPCHLGEVEQALDRAMRRIAPPEPPIVPDPGFAEGGDAFDAREDDGSPRTLEEVEREHILSTLQRLGGNRTATATELGISRRTLYYKLTEYQKQGYEVD